MSARPLSFVAMAAGLALGTSLLIDEAKAVAPAHTANGKAVSGAPTWTVDKAASRLTFRGTFSGDVFDGTFKRWDAAIAFDPKALARSHVSVTVDLASALTGDPTRDQALPTADWFSVAKFPKATFVSRGFRELGPGRYAVDGDLTLRGVKRPLTLPFTLAFAGRTATLQAAVAIDRTAFGVGQGQFRSSDTVGASVAVGIKLTAKRDK